MMDGGQGLQQDEMVQLQQRLAEEQEGLQKESVRLMRRVADRCKEEEKLAWATAYVMERKPKERQTLYVLAGLLHEHLAMTVSIVNTIPYLQLGGLGRGEGKDD